MEMHCIDIYQFDKNGQTYWNCGVSQVARAGQPPDEAWELRHRHASLWDAQNCAQLNIILWNMFFDLYDTYEEIEDLPRYYFSMQVPPSDLKHEDELDWIDASGIRIYRSHAPRGDHNGD